MAREPLAQSELNVVSTEAVGARDKLTYWTDLVCAHLVQVQCDPAARGAGFHGNIVQRQLPEMSISQISASAQRVTRTTALIGRSNDEQLLVNIQRSGKSLVRQDGREAVLLPGDIALYSSSRPYELEFDADFRQSVLIIPADMLRTMMPNVDNLSATTLSQARMGSNLLLNLAAGLVDAGQAAPLSIQRAAARGLLDMLASGLRGELGQARDVGAAGLPYHEALDAIEYGVFGVSPRGLLLFANRRAQELLGSGATFQQVNGHLHLGGYPMPLFAAALKRVASTGASESLLLQDRRNETSHCITISLSTMQRTVLLVWVSTPRQRQPATVRQLMQLFGLSPAEAKLSQALAQGTTLEEYCETRGLKMPTVRTQLRSVLQKTGQSRQQDLIRLLGTLPAVQDSSA